MEGIPEEELAKFKNKFPKLYATIYGTDDWFGNPHCLSDKTACRNFGVTLISSNLLMSSSSVEDGSPLKKTSIWGSFLMVARCERTHGFDGDPQGRRTRRKPVRTRLMLRCGVHRAAKPAMRAGSKHGGSDGTMAHRAAYTGRIARMGMGRATCSFKKIERCFQSILLRIQ